MWLCDIPWGVDRGSSVRSAEMGLSKKGKRHLSKCGEGWIGDCCGTHSVTEKMGGHNDMLGNKGIGRHG